MYCKIRQFVSNTFVYIRHTIFVFIAIACGQRLCIFNHRLPSLTSHALFTLHSSLKQFGGEVSLQSQISYKKINEHF